MYCEIKPRDQVPKSFHKLFLHVSQNYTINRVQPHEQGLRVGGGLRWEINTACVTNYRAVKQNKEVNNVISDKLHRVAAIDFSLFMHESALEEVYKKDILRLVQNRNYLKAKLKGGSPSSYINVHPSTHISKDLGNGPYCDPNDSGPSFARWYTDADNPGCTWFLFPQYSLAIECSTSTCISWNCMKQEHCSCTLNNKNADPVYYFSILRI